MEGNVDLLNCDIISIIGSRSCSENGINITRKFANELSSCGITIASGLASGIDSYAHLYSYGNIGKTIAVLGSGFDHIFPIKNIPLYNKILENNGLIISEYPPNTMWKSKYFLERNRIISGISLGILVIEASFRSGTSVTARLAHSQNRKIFAIPHEIWDSHGVGTNKLIKNGAILVTCVEDIFNELQLYEYLENMQNLNCHNNYHNNYHNIEKSFEHPKIHFSNKDCQDIYNLISDTPISVNDISKKTLKSINIISNALLTLELQGYIKKVAGGYICILNK